MPLTEEQKRSLVANYLDSYNTLRNASGAVKKEAIAQHEDDPAFAHWKSKHSVEYRDIQTFSAYCMDETTNTLDKEKFRGCIEDLISGDPERRRTWLEPLFQEANQYKIDQLLEMDPEKLIEDAPQQIRMRTVFRFLSDISKDPDVQSEWLPTATSREQLRSKTLMVLTKGTYLGDVHRSAGLDLLALGSSQYRGSLPTAEQLAESRQALEPILSFAQFQYDVQTTQRTSMTLDTPIDAENKALDLCNLSRDLQKGKLEINDPRVQNSKQLLYRLTSPITQNDYTRTAAKLSNRQINTEDLGRFYIDGKPATELFGERYQHLTNEAERNTMIAAEVVGSLTSGNHVVEFPAFCEENDGKLSHHMVTLKPDLTKIQPSIKDEHGWIHRNIFNFGPLKCRTRQEIQDETLKKADASKTERHEKIGQNVREHFCEPFEKITREKNIVGREKIDISAELKGKTMQHTKEIKAPQKQMETSMGK